MQKKFKLPTTADCVSCHEHIVERDVFAINIKLLGENINKFMCLNCLASYLEVTTNELLLKIEQFKSEGCKLFQ